MMSSPEVTDSDELRMIDPVAAFLAYSDGERERAAATEADFDAAIHQAAVELVLARLDTGGKAGEAS
ncbi:MAG: hypothetical protein HQL57_09320 [Magnetococcales bacterium]|nr:hypothetical protein [Magnetococcales bacterium]MBF0157368.1 hypothetical protein [Magnetococcales bacterium]